MIEGPRIPKQKKEFPMLMAALTYLKQGWNVIPVKPDKLPYLRTWKEYQQRMATEQEIREWWGKWPGAGIAVITGRLSGVVVVDVEAGGATLATKTLTATTGGGGKHYYFRHPGTEVPCAVRFRPDTDCRGDGGYAVVPPSAHRSGRRYRWDDPKAKALYITEKLLKQIQRGGQQRPLGADDWGSDIPDGERDVGMTRRAGRLLQTGMSAGEALEVLKFINAEHCKPQLSTGQLEKIVKSIAGREAAKKKDKAPAAGAKFTVFSQREMLRRYGEDETRWTVAEWLPEASCGLLVAPPGNYKTWLLEALAFSVATGRPFLGRYPVAGKGPVLFIQQEDPWWMLESRLARMFEQREPTATGDKNPAYELDCRFTRELDEMPVYWYTDRRLHFADKAVLREMEQKVAELRPRLIMIDPLYTMVDTKDYMAEGAQRMTALKLMRDSYGCSFVIAHHTTVAGSGSDDRSSIWGSQFLNAWLEFGWRMPKEGKGGNVVIRHFKNSESPKRIRVKFVITDWSFGVEIDEHYARSVSERIEETIMNGDAGSVRDIAEKIGCSKSTVQRVMRKMGAEEEEE
jgi:hypothetical protein